MRMGRVYDWTPDRSGTLGRGVTTAVVPLLRLASDGEGRGRLWGRHVRVRNGGAINERDPTRDVVRGVSIGDAEPNAEGDFLFQPGRGGGRIDKVVFAADCNSSTASLDDGAPFPDPEFRWRYVQASRFGEVNTYFHLDRIAAHINDLLGDLGARPLPQVVAVVNAHSAAVADDGSRDGVRRGERWVPFQGGHYRLSGRSNDPVEHEAISPTGEIHLGPGRKLLERGALVEAAGGRYRANASHNAGILYHEYGHHITRHTADLSANALRPTDRQSNRKTALDEGTGDYWAATMLDTPHIWSWHFHQDAHEVHSRSLTSPTTMADYDSNPAADAHANGTIWAAALWDLRTRLCAREPDGGRQTDRLVLKALLLMGRSVDLRRAATPAGGRRARENFAVGRAALCQADEILNGGRHRRLISEAFARRGIPSRSSGDLS